MLKTAFFSSKSYRVLSQIGKDSLPLQTSQSPPAQPSSNTTRISPAVLFIIIILAVIFFISGLLHLLVRFLIRKNPSSSSPQSNGHNQENSNSDALQRQLQQLFHLHDSGLDQAFIDALPVFLYKEIVGSKEPFDCAVCLSEFSQDDKLRLLPICGHAFHINCIETWLLSNSTCPLCRGALYVQGVPVENPMYEFDEEIGLEEGRFGNSGDVEEIGVEKRIVHVKLGKFRNISNRVDSVGELEGNLNGNSIITREEGESSSSNLDARRCYSMGSYQYVVGDANLRVSLRVEDGNGTKEKGKVGNSTIVENEDGKRLGVASKGESFSVSKIWLWGNNKGKLPDSSYASNDEGGLPWMMARRSEGNA